MSRIILPRQFNNPSKLQQALKDKPERSWVKRGEHMALQLFHNMSRRVPAYQDFLKKHHVKALDIKVIDDFRQLPLMSKSNYILKYPREALCWDGKFASERWVVSTTSGSTGEPYYFPRTDLQDQYYAVTAELYLRENFDIQNKTTLYINAFAMGAWIGGLFTYEAIKTIAEKGYSMTIISPGTNKAEVIKCVRALGADFDQVIIGCYPPIMKDILDLGVEEGVDWANYNLGIIFSAENFSEKFRDYIVKTGKLTSYLTSSLNHYGTADLGTMSHETPMSIMVRRQANRDTQLFEGLFGSITMTPTLTQYLPEMFYFEENNNGLICSSNSGFPLVRYDLKDRGGILSVKDVNRTYSQQGKSLDAELKKMNISRTKWNLPFVYVCERADAAIKLVGGLVYTGEIRRALLNENVVKNFSGKFMMEVIKDKNLNDKLVINAELKNGVTPSAAVSDQAQKAVTMALLKNNSEYANNYTTYGNKLEPVIKLWPYGYQRYFSGKIKQKWVSK